MIFEIYNWAFETKVYEELEEIGIEIPDGPSVIYDGDIWETARVIYDLGLNVKIIHSDKMPILFVDTKSFGQR